MENRTTEKGNQALKFSWLLPDLTPLSFRIIKDTKGKTGGIN